MSALTEKLGEAPGARHRSLAHGSDRGQRSPHVIFQCGHQRLVIRARMVDENGSAEGLHMHRKVLVMSNGEWRCYSEGSAEDLEATRVSSAITREDASDKGCSQQSATASRHGITGPVTITIFSLTPMAISRGGGYIYTPGTITVGRLNS